LNIFSRVLKKIARVVRHESVKRQARSWSQKNLENTRAKKLLVLCYGNIYRSPLVSEYLKIKLKETGLEVKSAGFYPVEGRCSPDEHVRMCMEKGVNLSHHRSDVLSNELLSWSDIVLIMDCRNWDLLMDMDPKSMTKVVWLGSFLENGDIEIEDPYGKSTEIAEQIVDRLLSASDGFVKKINTGC